MMPLATDTPFAMLSFLAGPAILTNASTVLALGTANRLARTSDRARAAATMILDAADLKAPRIMAQQEEFRANTRRTALLVRALNRFYLAAGLFAGATCIALIGALLDLAGLHRLMAGMQIATLTTVVLGVDGLVHGAMILVRETRVALSVVERQREAVQRWVDARNAAGDNLPQP